MQMSCWLDLRSEELLSSSLQFILQHSFKLWNSGENGCENEKRPRRNLISLSTYIYIYIPPYSRNLSKLEIQFKKLSLSSSHRAIFFCFISNRLIGKAKRFLWFVIHELQTSSSSQDKQWRKNVAILHSPSLLSRKEKTSQVYVQN